MINIQETFKDRLGKCYQLSWQCVTKNKGYSLVHGYITDRIKTGRTIDHAWCESGTIVYDPVMDKKFHKDVYYALYGVEVEKRYTSKEALDHGSKTGHYGPWHSIDKKKIKFP